MFWRILRGWTKAVFSKKISAIIRGNANKLLGRKNGLYRKRMRACGRCAEAVLVGGIGFICGICGCPLESKLRDPQSVCGEGKWGKEDEMKE